MCSITIIIPVFNVERYLYDCLKSVVKQSLDDYEVILVDDGSTDGSAQICDKFAEKYPQFRVIHQVNQGISAARNTGIQEANGEYLLFLDSDDFLVPESLPELLRLADRFKLDILGFRPINVSDNCKECPIKNQEISYDIDVVSGFDFIAQNNFVAQVWWYIMRRDIVVDNKIQFPVGHMLEDAAFNVRIFSRTNRMAQVNSVVYCYRNRPESIMHNCDKEHQQRLMWDYLYAAKDVRNALNDVKDLMNEACYERCRSRRDSYVFFGAIRALKLGKTKEYFTSAKEQGLYPFKVMNHTDYPGTKFTIIHWCMQRAWLWKTFSYLYNKIK